MIKTIDNESSITAALNLQYSLQQTAMTTFAQILKFILICTCFSFNYIQENWERYYRIATKTNRIMIKLRNLGERFLKSLTIRQLHLVIRSPSRGSVVQSLTVRRCEGRLRWLSRLTLITLFPLLLCPGSLVHSIELFDTFYVRIKFLTPTCLNKNSSPFYFIRL